MSISQKIKHNVPYGAIVPFLSICPRGIKSYILIRINEGPSLLTTSEWTPPKQPSNVVNPHTGTLYNHNQESNAHTSDNRNEVRNIMLH